MIIYEPSFPTMPPLCLEASIFFCVGISSSSHLWVGGLCIHPYVSAQKQSRVNISIVNLTGWSDLSRSCDSREMMIFWFVSGPLLVNYERGSYRKRAGNFCVLILPISYL